MKRTRKNRKVIRIGWYASGNIYDVDNNGLGYGMLYWHDLCKEKLSGTSIIDSETGKEMSLERIKSHL